MPISENDNKEWWERERLHFAAQDGDLEKVKILLAEGCPINAFTEHLPWTPLHHAARENHLEVVKYLIKMGADVNAYQEEKIGNTVLRDIAENCSYEMAKVLVDAGADPTIPGWMQQTALDMSGRRKEPEGKKVHKLLCETAKRLNPHWPRLKSFIE